MNRCRLVDVPGLTVDEVRCRSGRAGWSAPEQSSGYGIVFVRRGCFRRRCDGVELFADAGVAYCERPGQEQQVEHPRSGGDVCTALGVDEALLAAVAGGEPALPERPLFTPPALDLKHRLLVAGGGDAFELEERAIELVASVAAVDEPARAESGRPATAALRRRLVERAREALADRPVLTLTELAGEVSASPHHLSRIFAAATGAPVSRYRNRLRVRLALERLAEGESCLARLAAELGFADQSHLTRVVRRELGAVPSELRAALAHGSPSQERGRRGSHGAAPA